MDSVSRTTNSLNVALSGYQPLTLVVGGAGTVVGLWGLQHLVYNFADVKKTVLEKTFGALRVVPGVQGQIDKEKAKVKADLTKSFMNDISQERRLSIPRQPLSHEQIIRELTTLSELETGKWDNGKVSGAVYYGEKGHGDLLCKVYSLFAWSNPLHPDIFPGVRKLDSEVIRMTADMVHGDKDVCGAVTSGGTESILMAIKAYRDFYKKKNPEIIACVSAHAAFDKAAGYFGVKIVHVPMDKSMRADVEAVRRAINKNTIAIVGSAPQFPHGVIDPIQELAALASKHGVGFHTDACLGGFFLPWAQRKHSEIPPFDFTVPGVTSMSVDTHKYGYTTKGTSVVLFRTPELRHAMYFVTTEWPGGTYASPTMSGSRPGALTACAWASLVAIGQSGYEEISEKIYQTAQEIKRGITQIPGLCLVADSYSSVIAWGSSDPHLNVYEVADAMKNRGWNLNVLQKPASVHICCTYRTVGHAKTFLRDLTEATAQASRAPDSIKNGQAHIYGLAAALPDRSIIRDIALAYVDSMLDP